MIPVNAGDTGQMTGIICLILTTGGSQYGPQQNCILRFLIKNVTDRTGGGSVSYYMGCVECVGNGGKCGKWVGKAWKMRESG